MGHSHDGRVQSVHDQARLMHDSVAYRANAAACAKVAMEVADPRRKLSLVKMAEAWMRLADYVERRDAATTATGNVIPPRDE
jgi:hypothetical protein